MSARELPPAPDPLPVRAIDAHTHLDACGATTPSAVSAALDRAQAAGIAAVVTVADDLASARWVVEASTWDGRLYGAVALHPTRTKDFGEEQKSEIERLARAERVVSVGETGLDYYWDFSPPRAQQEAFRWHIDLAKRLDKPLMIHDRDAHEDVLRILREEGAPRSVIFHCFSGDAEFARRCVAQGYLLSFAGTVTFRNARDLHEAAKLVPDEQLLVETDAPFLTPHPFRGRPNEPYCAAYTVRGLAELREQPLEAVAEAVRRNAERVLRLPEVGTATS